MRCAAVRFRALRAVAVGLMLVGLAGELSAQEKSAAATRQYNAAVALQNRGAFDLAADEWAKFIAAYQTDPRLDCAQHYLGVCYLKTNKLDLAQQCFETVIKNYPKCELLDAAHLNLGVARYGLAQGGKAEMYDAAADAFNDVVAKFPQSKHVAKALFYRGESFYHRGKKAEAAEMYAQLAAKFPNDPLLADALYALGVTQEELGRQAEAGKTYDQFLLAFPQSPLAAEVTMRRAETLFAQGQFEPAAQRFAVAAAAKDFALADQATSRQAAALAQLKKYAEAAALYASVTKKWPQSKLMAASNLAGGKCGYLAGNFAEARRMLELASASGGESTGEAAHWLARCLLKEGRPVDAIAVVEKLLPKLNDGPQKAQLLLDQADAIYEIAERRSESAALYAALAAKYPKDAVGPQALYMAAFAALGKGDFEAALRHASAFTAAYPDHELLPDVAYLAAESELQLGRYAEADKQFAQLIEKYPNGANLDAWKARRAVALSAQKKYAETIALVEPMLAAGPKWPQADETLAVLARAYSEQKDAVKAKAALLRLVAEFPESRRLADAHFALGENALTAKDYAAAAAEYQQVIDKWPDSPLMPRALYGLGWAKLNQGDHAGAVKVFDSLVKNHPEHKLIPRARYARALGQYQLKQFAPALEDAQAILAADPTPTEKSDARYLVGLCQAGLQRPGDAAATFQVLVKDDPNYPSADKVFYELAWAQKQQGQEKEAAETFAKLATQSPSSPLAAEAQYHVGEFAAKSGEFPKAAAAYQASLDKAGRTELGEKAAYKLAWAQFRLNDFAAAQQKFRQQRAAWPQGALAADAAFMDGECLMKLKKYEEALAAYEQAKKPSGEDFALLALLHAGQAAGQLKQWEKSLELLAACVKQFPDSPYLPEAMCEQGWAKQNLGKLDEAAKLYGQVIGKTNREAAARAQFQIGRIQAEQKNHAEAVKSFFKVSYGYSFPQWQADAAYEAARSFEALGKKEQAVKLYQELIDKYPQSDKTPPAKQRLGELK